VSCIHTMICLNNTWNADQIVGYISLRGCGDRYGEIEVVWVSVNDKGFGIE
jgi:hypothetical protein